MKASVSPSSVQRSPVPLVVVCLPWPPTSNHNVKHANGGHYLSREHKLFRTDVATLILMAGVKHGSERLMISMEAFPPDRRRRDIDNLIKPVLDALQHGGAYADDSQVDAISIKRGEIRSGGAIEVILRETH